MRLLIAAMTIALLAIGPSRAEAATRHHVQQHRHHVSQARHGNAKAHHRVTQYARHRHTTASHAAPAELVTVQTAAGIPITVASHLVTKFTGFIADLVATGYHPRHIGSFARSGHVRNSRHYAGAALDIDQRGWGKTAAFMHSNQADAIAKRHGLRNGRSFGDAGHIDDGVRLGRSYASRHMPRRAAIRLASRRPAVQTSWW